MRTRLLPLLASGALLVAALPARAADARLAPLPHADAASTHGPYEMGSCEACHQRHDAKDPGTVRKVSNDLCFECHDEFKGKGAVKLERMIHPGDKASCTSCHNPHNSRKKKLQL